MPSPEGDLDHKKSGNSGIMMEIRIKSQAALPVGNRFERVVLVVERPQG